MMSCSKCSRASKYRVASRASVGSFSAFKSFSDEVIVNERIRRAIDFLARRMVDYAVDDVLSILASASDADAIWEDLSQWPKHRVNFHRCCQRDRDSVSRLVVDGCFDHVRCICSDCNN